MEHDQPALLESRHHDDQMTCPIRANESDLRLAEPVVDVVHGQLTSDGVDNVFTALAVLERGSANSDVKPI